MSYNVNIDPDSFGAVTITVAAKPRKFDNADGSCTLKLSGYHRSRGKDGKSYSDLLEFERFVPASQTAKVLSGWPWGELDAGDRMKVYFQPTGRMYTGKDGQPHYKPTLRVTDLRSTETKAERNQRRAKKAERAAIEEAKKAQAEIAETVLPAIETPEVSVATDVEPSQMAIPFDA